MPTIVIEILKTVAVMGALAIGLVADIAADKGPANVARNGLALFEYAPKAVKAADMAVIFHVPLFSSWLKAAAMRAMAPVSPRQMAPTAACS